MPVNPTTPENGISSPSEAKPNDGYELLAFTTALLLVVFIGLIPTLIDAKLKQLPFCLIGLAFVFGALLAYHHQHQRTEQVSYWMPRLMAVLGVKQPEVQA